MRLLAVVITYLPDAILLRNNISAFSKNVDHILLWDNTPAPGMDKRMIEGLGGEYVSTGQNEGISKALNYAWKYAKRNGYDCLLTMDQDSVFEDFAAYRKAAEKFFEENGDCIIGPWYYPPVPKNDDNPVIERDSIITSGMIVPICILDEVGGYYEEFKVDCIDTEFCIRVKRNGYQIIQCINHCLKQQFGRQYEKKVLGHTFSGPGYGPSRLYEIMRNHLITYRKYDHPLFLEQQIHWSIVNYIPNIIFAENQKIRKLYNIFKGLWDGWRFNIQ